MMKTSFVNIGDWSDVQNHSVTSFVDHSVTSFVVAVRSINTVGPDSIKNLIEKKFEVISIEETDLVHMVR